MMAKKYLLYVDILGFGSIVKNDPEKVERIYGILDSLNAHKHDVFKTIVFSDTVLVYSDDTPTDRPEDHEYLVWYSIEFAEDLHHRLTGQDVYFRAVLLYGEFQRYSLENVEAFFGCALVDAYSREKSIPSLGLFIDERCNKYNKYFQTAPFSDDLRFVYLCRSLEGLQHITGGTVPITAPHPHWFDDNYPNLAWQVKFLEDVHKNMRGHPNPNVRVKHLTVWDFYEQRYPNILTHLVNNNFALQSISEGYDFSVQLDRMTRDIEYFGKGGSPSILDDKLP